MHISYPKTYSDVLKWVACIWAASICFPALQGSFYGVFAILLYGVFKGHLGFSFNYRHRDDRQRSNEVTERSRSAETPVSFWKSRKTPFYFLLAYLLWMTATVLWSDDIREYFRQFEKLIPLYLLVGIGFMEGIEKHLNINKVLHAFLWGVVICVGYMVLRMGVDMFIGDTIGRIKTAGIMSLDLLSYVNHRTYIGITLLMAIPLLAMQLKQQSRWQQLSTIAFVLFIDMLCIMSGARILMILSVLVTLYAFYYVWGRQVKWWWQWLFLVSFIALGTVVIMQNQRVQSKLVQMQQGADVESVESRTYVWISALELIKEKPLFGYGMGDVEDALVQNYQAHNYEIAVSKKLNAHNQYLQITLLGGGVALVLFLMFFIVLIAQSKGIQPIGIVFILVFGIAMLVESVLVRNIGVMPLILIVIILQFTKQIEVTFNLTSPKVGILLLATVFFFYSEFTPVSSEKVRTFITGNYEIVRTDKCPNKNEINANSVFAISYNDIASFYSGYYSYFHLPETKHFTQGDSLNATILCYVEDLTAVDKVSLIVVDSNKQNQVRYDIKRVGHWQKLEVKAECMSSDIRVFVFMRLKSKHGPGNGKVYFATPKLFINGKSLYN